MEHSFGRNSEVVTHVHEPFIRLRQGNADLGYQTIYDTVEANLDPSDTPMETTVVIKEMSQWIGIGQEYEKLFSLTESPVIFLIRNPLLATESRIKKLIQTLDLREKPAVQETLLNYYATTQGYKDWEAFNETHKDTPDDLVDNEFVLQFRNSTDGSRTEGTPSLQTQLLDYFAQSKGHEDWRDMIKEVFANRDYKKFYELLWDERIYGVAGTGWEALAEQVKYLDSQDKSLFIVDSTDFRLEPETIVPALCREWELPFSEDMIVWDNKGLEVNTGQTKPHQVIWYDRLQTSTGIEAPSEISPVLEDFPDFIAEHLVSVDLPAYVNLFNHSSRIKPRTNVSEKMVDVRMRKAAYKRLRDMGILPTDMEFRGRGDQDQEIFDLLSEHQLLDYSANEANTLTEAYAHGKTTIAFSMQDIDPIFAYLSNPDIREDTSFRVINHRYLNTLDRISNIIEES